MGPVQASPEPVGSRCWEEGREGRIPEHGVLTAAAAFFHLPRLYSSSAPLGARGAGGARGVQGSGGQRRAALGRGTEEILGWGMGT